MRLKTDKYQWLVVDLCNLFADWQRGSTIPWETIEQTIDRKRTDRGGWTIINRFRRRLLFDREIVTLPHNEVGLRLLTNSEAAIEIPRLRQRRAYRQVNRALKETGAINDGELPDALRLSLARQRQLLAQQRLTIGRSRRELESGLRPTQTHPVRPELTPA
jgi:hypothetical protein